MGASSKDDGVWLKLQSEQDERGARVPHRDVALVLEHYARWCRRCGRPVVFRPLDVPGH
ncbi:hypothetical protein [Brachybacterium avium]|uniref:hypothetical protein n=1 Tax=Brachybacterium avium TaxID=2017485 RepID=UPI0012FE40EF|nr:hypothetical protein [Brachybacterium avium]